jgi:hypothetical protein
MFTKSENFKEEYCAQIVKVGELFPIENSDFLARTTINGFNVVVGKNDVKEGDIMLYAKLETEVNTDFLSVNNQFEIGERHLNKNYNEIQNLIDEGKDDEAKKLVGYFNKYGRVRIVKLRKCPSEGCLFTIDSLVKWKPELANYDFNQCFVPNADGVVEPFCFDTIGKDLFVKAYVPRVSNREQARADKAAKRNKRLKRFDRMIEGQFSFHYDTNQLADNMWRFNPDTVVTVSTKLHGTSHIVGRVLVKKPLPVSIIRMRENKRKTRQLKYLYKSERRFYWQRKVNSNKINSIKNYLDSQYTVDYGKVTSSRGVIKNQYINTAVTKGFYGVDIWTEYGDLLYPYLINGMQVFSEIVGYATGGQNMIQKGYDYGCAPGTNKIMPYRITVNNDDGTVTEWDVMEVYGWTLQLLKEHPELKDKVMPIDILYHGTLGDLYPEVNKEQHWNDNVLVAMRNDKEHFKMEENEPLCKNKMPREGVVIRIDGDAKSEAFKLKTYKFLGKEAELMDKGEVDAEMDEAYVN